ncbi:MAG: nucleotidyltransferase family protein [Hominenteromicrobium sp.]
MVAKNRISGIICEFNPLHNGHAALLRQVRRDADGGVVCIMSGSFVQRGEATVLDKWSRTRLALENGADLILELPLPWAMSGAERFALGGVSLLNALGGADRLVFGSECGDAAPLLRIAEYLLSPQFSADIRPYLAAGLPFAAARGKAIEKALGPDYAALNEQPNNILGIEYCKALLRLGSGIIPYAVPRVAVGHDAPDASGRFASASLIRQLSFENKPIAPFVPESTAARIEALRAEKQYPADIRHLERAVLALLAIAPPERLRTVPDVSEGIENRIHTAAGSAASLEALYDAVKTKRYSHARIRRIVLSAFLGLTNDLPATPPYLRVLGMNERGTEILRTAKPALPYVTRPADVKKLPADAQRVFELEARADDLYSLCTEQRRPAGLDYTEKLIRL